MAESDESQKRFYINDSGECIFCDEKNLEWRDTIISLNMSAQAMWEYKKMKVNMGFCLKQYGRPYKDDKIHDCRGLWKCKRCGEEGMYNLAIPNGEIWRYKAERDGERWIGKLHDCRRDEDFEQAVGVESVEKIVCNHCGEVYKFDKNSTDINDGTCDECKDCKSLDEWEERGKMNPNLDEDQMEPPSHYDPCEHCGSIDHPSEDCTFSGYDDEGSGYDDEGSD